MRPLTRYYCQFHHSCFQRGIIHRNHELYLKLLFDYYAAFPLRISFNSRHLLSLPFKPSSEPSSMPKRSSPRPDCLALHPADLILLTTVPFRPPDYLPGISFRTFESDQGLSGRWSHLSNYLKPHVRHALTSSVFFRSFL